MKVLELFCGTKSFTKVAQSMGHETFTVDFDPRFNPDMCINILDLKAEDILNKFGKPDVIWASPPCTCFSMLSVYKHWNRDHTPKTQQCFQGIELVKKTLKLIEELQPQYWILENPRGMLRTIDFMKQFRRSEVTYCQYGDTRMKPTDLWNNITQWKSKPRCKNGAPCHIRVPRGSALGTQGMKNAKLRAVIPPQLCQEILTAIKEGA